MNNPFTRMTLILSILLCSFGVFSQSTIPLPAHSRLDYEQPRALFSALQLRYASVEADVYLVDGELLVGRNGNDLMQGRTLGNLYLEPFRLLSMRNGGQIYSETTSPVLLIVDIKTEAEATYQQLERTLGPYERFLTRFTPDSTELGAVTVIVSGNRSKELMEHQEERFSAYDGEFTDLTSSNVNPNFMPIISGDWSSVFDWRGSGNMPDEERQRLEAFSQLARDNDVKLRFVATPEIPPVWQELDNANVDLIEAERIDLLSQFLSQ